MPEPTPPPVLGLSTAKAARILGVTDISVSRYVARGLLHRTTRWYSLDRDEVEQLAVARWRPGHPYWLRTKDAAELLGVSPGTVKRYARQGRLPFLEHASRRYYRRPQLEVIANAREARLLG